MKQADVTVTVWTVVLGADDGESLVALALSVERALVRFEELMRELPGDVTVRPEGVSGGRCASAGLDWVRLRPHRMPVELSEWTAALARGITEMPAGE